MKFILRKVAARRDTEYEITAFPRFYYGKIIFTSKLQTSFEKKLSKVPVGKIQKCWGKKCTEN